jgi:transposase
VNKKVTKSNSDGRISNMYIGMDLHKKYLQVAVVDEKGKVMKNSKIDNDLDEIGKFFNDVNNQDAKVVMESSGVWYNIYEYLSEQKHLDVVLSNPLKTKAIATAKIKTDKLDALKLADLLRGGYIAECYIPDKKTMGLRELVRHRLALVKTRTRMKNKIHGIILMKGVRITGIHPFTRKHIEKLKEIKDYRIDGYLRMIESLDSEINDVSRKIKTCVSENDIAKLLMTIPGIGYYSALLIVSEIGDITRFPDSHHLCSYAGLVPSTHSSGGITYHGSITKIGSRYLRWVMVECVRAHIRNYKNTSITKFYERLAKIKGNSKAVVAAASKLLKVVYWIIKERREYVSYHS